MDTKPQAFIVAAKAFFGFQPNQTLLEFKNEVGQLTQKDREELAPLLSIALGHAVAA